MSNILNEEDCKKILSKLDTTAIYTHFTLQHAPKSQDGFFGDSFILTVSYKTNEKQKNTTFFVKTFPESKEHGEMAKKLLAYEKEMFFYEFLLEEYKKIGCKSNFVPECYYIKNKTLVLEDLNVKGYKTELLFNLEQIKSCLSTLAHLHAASLLYEEHMSKETIFRLGDEYKHVFEEKFFDIDDKNSFIYKHFSAGFDCIVEFLKYFPENDEFKNTFLKKLEQNNFSEIFRKDLRFRKVVSHGDLWRRNIMFQTNTYDCKLIDFQMLRYYYPAFDVLSLMYFNLSKKLLEEHKFELIEHYYNTLKLATDNLVTSIIPYEEFILSVKHFEYLAIFQAATGHTLDLTGNVTDCFFGDRAQVACKEFLNNERYRNVMMDDIYCLIDNVFNN